jgi:ring-1,2-phenylacetyl-CoA epoxidase subunit PaaC
MRSTSIRFAGSDLAVYVLQRADDALVLGHRLSEWCGHAPMLEEDIALANIGLDLIGQARTLYTYAAEAEGAGHDEDQLAYLRDERDYRNLLLLEQPNGDFAHTMVRQFLYAAYADPYWRAMCGSADARLAAIAAKAEKECAYHLRHAAEWMIRLGDGTEESHRRAQVALDALWPYSGEMFAKDAHTAPLLARNIACDPAALVAGWNATVDDVLRQATLSRLTDGWMQRGGREGRHSEHLGYLLAELQFMQRSYPGVRW